MTLSIPAPRPFVSVREILYRLGFVEDWEAMTDCAPGFIFQAGNLCITANQVTSEYLRPEFSFGGMAATSSKLHSIGFSIPLMVESFAQTVAWITFGVGLDFVPTQPIEWLEDGKRWQDQLPWELHRRHLLESEAERLKLRKARPHCSIERDWMRTLRTRLRGAVDSAGEGDEFVVGFDGQMFTVTLPGSSIRVDARGSEPWPCSYRGQVAQLSRISKRFRTDPIEIGIWEAQLEIEYSRLDVTPESGGYGE